MMGVSNLLHGLGNGIDIQNVVVGFSMDIQPSYNVWSITSDLDVSWYKPSRLGDNLTGSSSPDPARCIRRYHVLEEIAQRNLGVRRLHGAGS